MMLRILSIYLLFCFGSVAIAEPLSLELFAKKAQYNSIKISPDGKHFAAAAPYKDQTILVIINRESMKPVYAFRFSKNEHVDEYYWANNERVVFTRILRKGWAEAPISYRQIFAGNIDGSKQAIIFGYSGGKSQTGSRLGKNKGPDRAWGEILHLLPEDPKHIIISARAMDNSFDSPYRLIKLNIYNSRKKEITRTPFGNLRVMFNTKGIPVIATGHDSKGIYKSFGYVDDDWIEITSENLLANFTPISINKAGDKLYLSTHINSKTSSIFEYDIESTKMELIFNHKSADFYSLIKDPEDGAVIGVEVMPNYLEYHYLDEDNEFAKTHKKLVGTFKNQGMRITSRTKDLKEMVVFIRNDKNPGDFYLYNNETNSAKYLLSRKRWINPKLMAPREPIQFQGRDGTTLYGYITIPLDTSKKVPLVTYVHGGPYGLQDQWWYDSTAQMLANNGFAVLQVNYRGSGGYGLSYERSAYQKLHTMIQNDIIDGTKYAMSFDEIENNNACIMGWSFGGYSALMAPLVDDSIFKCSIAAAGVYDAVEQLDDADYSKVDSLKAEAEIKWGENENSLRKASPLTYLDKLKIPVFIVHGGKDERVPPEQAYMLKKALDKRKMPYEWMFKKKEGHGFYNQENMVEFYQRSLKFLNKYLRE